ncbi:MAG TPA: HAD-IA family hydrolase [Verrucomicrobiae bacterium]|jgi:dihydrofolate synthase/folylpolyglutamate synthase|nr:HAD-IA family hydrolase [Verrucomicrobiae bacterium]
MSYAEAIQFLYDLRLFGMKLGLENTRRLAAAAGDPHLKLRFIHVAGTNGKGSTCAMLENIYRAAGLRVGLFTSPHLVSFAERIQVNRVLISREDVARLAERIRAITDKWGEQSQPTFFEVVAVIALQYFAEQKCELVIWETGLGGRLDATNIVTPLAGVITNVQFDHQKWLGDTIAEIAAEKAGIIKPGIPIITTAEDPDALNVISQTAQRLRAPLTIVGKADQDFEVALAGEHQKTNAALAAAVARILAPQIPVSESAIRNGLKTAQWNGRQQLVDRPGGRKVLLDGAHNAAGAQTLADAVQTRFPSCRPALAFGAMRDKDCAAICKILAPLAGQILISPVSSERGADPHWLADLCRQSNSTAPITICSSIADALARAAEEQLVVVTGSLHLVGDAMVALGLADATDEAGLNDYQPRQDLAAIRAVTFDVGGTLLEPWPSVGHVYAEIAAKHGVHVPAEKLDRQFAAAWKAKKNFGYSAAEWSDLVIQTFDGLAPPPSEALFSDLYSHFASATPWRIFDDVLPCLQRLKRRGLKLGVISNWDERLRPLLHALELDEYFDVVIVSSETGRHKPDAGIFDAATASLGVSAETILHVGDSATEDFEGARQSGFRSLLLRREGTGGPGTISSLDRLLN